MIDQVAALIDRAVRPEGHFRAEYNGCCLPARGCVPAELTVRPIPGGSRRSYSSLRHRRRLDLLQQFRRRLARAAAFRELRTAEEVVAAGHAQLHGTAALGARLADLDLRRLLLRPRRRE